MINKTKKSVFLQDLISLKNKILSTSKKKWSGFSCHWKKDDKETRCYYDTDIGGIKIDFMDIPNFYGDGGFAINFFENEKQFDEHYKDKFSKNENAKQNIAIFSEKIGKWDIVINHATNTINFIHW